MPEYLSTDPFAGLDSDKKKYLSTDPNAGSAVAAPESSVASPEDQAGKDYLNRIADALKQPARELSPQESARTGMLYQEPGEVTGGTQPDPENKFGTAVVHTIQPLIEHPLESAYKMVVPQKEDIEAIKQLFTDPNKAFSRDTPIGSQEWWDQVVGLGSVVVPLGFGLRGGRPSPTSGTREVLSPGEEVLHGTSPQKAPPRIPSVGDTIQYEEDWPNPRTVTAKVVRLSKNPVPGGEPLIPVVDMGGGKEWPASEWFVSGRIVSPQKARVSSDLAPEQPEIQPEPAPPVQTTPEIVRKPLETPVSNHEAPAANPNDFRPALKTDEGVISGQLGQTHQDIYDAQPDPVELRASEPEHGFVDPNGDFKTREEVSAALGEASPMQSERLAELQSPPTSTKNAAVETSREARDLDPVEKEASRSFGTVMDEANQIVEKDPSKPERLANEIAAKPRPVSDTENALLIRRLIDAKNEHDAAVEGVNTATDDASRAEAQIRLEQAREDYHIADTAATHAGTKTAQGLNARRMMVNDDYSLARMEATKRAANGGRKLNPKQLSEVKALSDKMTDIRKKISNHETKERFDQLVREARAEARGKTLDRFIDERAEAARQRLRDVVCEI